MLQISLTLFVLILLLPALIFFVVSNKQRSITPQFLISIGLLALCYFGVLFYLSKGEPYPYLQNAITEGLRTIPPLLEKNKEVIENLKKTNPVQIETWVSGLRHLSENAPKVAQTFIQEKLFGYAASALLLILWLFVISLRSLGVTVTSTDLTRWKVPDHLVWLAIISYILREISIPILSPISKNMFIVLEVIYFLHGLSIVAFFFKTRRASSIQKNFFHALFFLFPIVTASIGFFDLWLDFRNKIEKSQKKSVLDRNNVKGGA